MISYMLSKQSSQNDVASSIWPTHADWAPCMHGSGGHRRPWQSGKRNHDLKIKLNNVRLINIYLTHCLSFQA